MISRRTFLGRSLTAGAAVASGLPVLPALASRLAFRSLHERVAQLFVISFRGVTAEREILSLLDRYAFGGVILYSRNCKTAHGLRGLLSQLQGAARYPLLVCVDQEGGRVVRIHDGAPAFPWEAVYGQLDSASQVYADATTTALDLRALGLTMNLAPVVDVLSNHRSPIGRRSYGPDPHVAARLSVSAIQGYQQHGLAATAKHFVGLGHTSIDSHHRLPTITQTLGQLQANDLIPFRAAISAGVSTVLVAHVAVPAIDPVYRPASLSPVIIEGLLRRRLGFRGAVMTDSLIMGALPRGQEPEAAEQALAAGADILLMSGSYDIPAALIEESVERVVTAILTGRIPESRLQSALMRVLALKQRYPPAPLPPTLSISTR